MNSLNGDAPVLAEIERLAGRLDEEIAELERQRAEIGSSLVRLRALQRALTPPEERNTTRGKSRSDKLSHASPRMVRLVADGILRSGAEVFSALQVGELLAEPMSGPTLYESIKKLREEEVIGKAGKIKGSGATMRDAFRVLDHDRLAEFANAAS
jgi:hypothetical protein